MDSEIVTVSGFIASTQTLFYRPECMIEAANVSCDHRVIVYVNVLPPYIAESKNLESIFERGITWWLRLQL
jgi:hypothetical protein